MAVLNIRNLPDEVHVKLRVRAAKAGRSMEAEAREILTAVVLLIPIFKPFRAELGLQIIPAQMGRHGVMALLALGLYLLLAQYGFQGATKISTSEGKSALPRFREL